jgi:cytidylate kinase
MIISLSGAPGSGKSTIAQMLADKLNYPRYYIGGLRREKAKERGMTLAEYNKLGEIDRQTDQEIDNYQSELSQKEADFVIEGRTSWHFIPQSFKIYLDVDEKEGAKRIFKSLQAKNDRNEDKELNNWEDVLKSNQRRVASDRSRYEKYYNIDIYDFNNYDFYLDTTNLTPKEVLAVVWQSVGAELDKRKN